MKRILFVLTNYRVFEKYIEFLNEIASSGNILMDLYFMGQASVKTPWPGDIDKRAKFQEEISKHANVSVINGTGLERFGEYCKNPFFELGILDKYCGIWYDDNRILPAYHINSLYNAAKSLNIPMIGNSHGNQEFLPANLSALGYAFDHIMLLGNKETQFYSNFYDSSRLHAAGIPSNDKCKNYLNIDGNSILCITNFLSNHNPLIFKNNFDKTWANVLSALSNHYSLPLVIKQKGRLDDPNYQKNIDYIRNLFSDTGVHPTILSDVDNDIELIANAKYVISALSTMSFKAIQLKKPTILIENSGQYGNFTDYPYISSLVTEDIRSMIDNYDYAKVDNFLEKTLTGSVDFSSLEKYIQLFNSII